MIFHSLIFYYCRNRRGPQREGARARRIPSPPLVRIAVARGRSAYRAAVPVGFFPRRARMPKPLMHDSYSRICRTGVATDCVASGGLSDRISDKAGMIAAWVLLNEFSYPLPSMALASASIRTVVPTESLFTALGGLFPGSMPVALVEMCSTTRRLTGLTTACNLRSMIFAGFARFIFAAV